MKPLLAALVVLALISYGANYGLSHYAGFSASDRTTVGNSVRLGD